MFYESLFKKLQVFFDSSAEKRGFFLVGNWMWYLILVVAHHKFEYGGRLLRMRRCMVGWKIFLKEMEGNSLEKWIFQRSINEVKGLNDQMRRVPGEEVMRRTAGKSSWKSSFAFSLCLRVKTILQSNEESSSAVFEAYSEKISTHTVV